MHEIRCGNGILFGVIEGRTFEVKCRSRRCGHEAGVVIIHRFDLLTGDLVGTSKFRDPNNRKDEDHASRQQSSVRAP